MAEQWERHVEKLRGDCERLAIPPPCRQVFDEDLAKLGPGLPDCVLKLMVTRGAGQRGYASRGGSPTRILMTAALATYPKSYYDGGVQVRICALRLSTQPALAGIKHLNRLENVLARAEWDDEPIAEGLLCDNEMNVIGGTMTNVFAVRSGGLVTPSLDRCGVAGVTRDRVLDATREVGIHTEVRALPLEELFTADEIFLTNSVIGVWRVSDIDGRMFPGCEVTNRIRRHLRADSDARVA